MTPTQQADELQPYYRLWITHNNGIDPCWQGDDFSGHEYIIWINNRWVEYYNGKRPDHISDQDQQLFLAWLTRKVTGL